MAARVVTATEARVRFGELIRDVVEKDQPVVVERGGKEMVVILSVDHYRRLEAGANEQESWWLRLERLDQQVERDLAGRSLPDMAEEIRAAREERDEQILGLR